MCMDKRTHILYRKCNFILNRFLPRLRQEQMPMSSNTLLFSMILMQDRGTDGKVNNKFCHSITLTSCASWLQHVGGICHAVGISKHFCYMDDTSPIRTKGGT